MLDASGNYSNIYNLLQKNFCVWLRSLADAVNLFIMNTKIENIGDTRKKIIITFSPEQVEEENAKVIADFVRNVKIPGFRPGKAPQTMVEKLYSASIKEQLEHSLTGKAVEELNAIKDFDIYAIADMKHEEKNGGFEFEFVADIYPEVKLPETLETKVELDSTDATDAEIENALEYYRNQRAKYDEVDREIQKGDFVRLSYKGSVDGTPISEIEKNLPIFGEQKSTWEEAGNESAPGVQGIVQGIIGMKKGEKKTLSHEFPKEFPNENLAGKKADYEVEIFEIREKKLPELDADFFKAFEVDSLDALKNKIRDSIVNEKKSNNEILKRQFAVEQLMGKTDFPLPETALEDERQSILEEMMMRFMSSGASREDLEKNKEAIYENAGKEAEGRAKMRIFLNRVAKANDLKIDNEDMSRMLWQEAMRSHTKPEELIKQLRKDPARANRLRSDALLQKAINFIAEKTQVEIKPAEAAK